MFGADVNIVAIKRGAPGAGVSGRLKESFPEDDGVVLGFEPEIRRLLNQRDPAFPDLQTASPEAIRRVFAPAEWELKTSAAGSRSVVSRSPEMRILAQVAPGSLLLMRLYAARLDQPYRVSLFLGDDELAGVEVVQSESFLLSAIAGRSGQMSLRITPRTGHDPAAPRSLVSLSYAAAIAP